MGTERKKQLILQLVGVGNWASRDKGEKSFWKTKQLKKKKKKRKEGTFSRDSEDCHIATAESGAKGKKKRKRATENKAGKKTEMRDGF